MNKKEMYKQELITLVNECLEKGDYDQLSTFFVSNSNLPGRRANIELANAFGDVIVDVLNNDLDPIWYYCSSLMRITDKEAPTNDPCEFLPFCGANGIGAIGAISEKYFQDAISCLKERTQDTRWRMHEAIRMGIQRILLKGNPKMWEELASWIEVGNWLQIRAVASSVADPSILRIDQKNAIVALELHKKIFETIKVAKNRKSEEFKRMRKGLGYTLSVITYEIPIEGFYLMKELIKTQDLDLHWIIKQNLAKKRLTKPFQKEVISIKELF